MTTEGSSPLRPLGVGRPPEKRHGSCKIYFVQNRNEPCMGDFNEILKAAMRKAASLAAKETVESLLRTETKTILGYDRHDPSGKNSGDSRNGTYQRTVQTSLGPISVEVPRDRNGEYKRSPSRGTDGGPPRRCSSSALPGWPTTRCGLPYPRSTRPIAPSRPYRRSPTRSPRTSRDSRKVSCRRGCSPSS